MVLVAQEKLTCRTCRGARKERASCLRCGGSGLVIVPVELLASLAIELANYSEVHRQPPSHEVANLKRALNSNSLEARLDAARSVLDRVLDNRVFEESEADEWQN